MARICVAEAGRLGRPAAVAPPAAWLCIREVLPQTVEMTWPDAQRLDQNDQEQNAMDLDRCWDLDGLPQLVLSNCFHVQSQTQISVAQIPWWRDVEEMDTACAGEAFLQRKPN